MKESKEEREKSKRMAVFHINQPQPNENLQRIKIHLKRGSNLNTHLNSCKRLLALVLLLNKSPDAVDKRFLLISLGVS